MTPNTALAALHRLSPWFVVIGESGEFGMLLTPGATLDGWLNETPMQTKKVISIELTPLRVNCKEGVNSIEMTFNEYSPRKAGDAYQSGTSRQVKRRAKDAIASATRIFTNVNESRRVRGAAPVEMCNATPRSWIEDKTLPGMGETGLRILDALTRCGEMTVDELAGETGKSAASIRNYMPRLHAVGAVEWTKEGRHAPKVWWIDPDAFATIEAKKPEMRTCGMADGREDAMLEQSQLWVAHQHRAAKTQEDRDTAWRRGVKLENKRTNCLMRLHGWDESVARGVATDLPYRQWLGRRAAQSQARREADERIADFEMAEAQRATVAAQVADLPRNEAARMLRIAGHDAGDIARLAQVAL